MSTPAAQRVEFIELTLRESEVPILIAPQFIVAVEQSPDRYSWSIVHTTVGQFSVHGSLITIQDKIARLEKAR